MLEIILKLLEVSFWSGIAAVGFGVLFNVPKSAVITIFALGFGAGFIKFLLMHLDVHVVLGSFLAAFFVAFIPIEKRIILTHFFNFLFLFKIRSIPLCFVPIFFT